MKLYYAPGACSHAVHIALREAGLPFSLEKVDLRARRTETGLPWESINPKGYVPVLELDDGQRLTEAPNLLTYVADQRADLGLAPPPLTMERYRLEEWLAFISSELHKTFGPLFTADYPAEAAERNRQRLRKRFEYVARELGALPYLAGDRFTVADGFLLVMLNWADRFGIPLQDLENLTAYRARVAGRPSVQEARRAEGLA